MGKEAHISLPADCKDATGPEVQGLVCLLSVGLSIHQLDACLSGSSAEKTASQMRGDPSTMHGVDSSLATATAPSARLQRDYSMVAGMYFQFNPCAAAMMLLSSFSQPHSFMWKASFFWPPKRLPEREVLRMSTLRLPRSYSCTHTVACMLSVSSCGVSVLLVSGAWTADSC